MEKAFEIQRAARENVQDLKSFMTDLSSWEKEMKRKEAALQGKTEQDLPPVRSKLKKAKQISPVSKKKPSRIKGTDYNSWDKFDVEAACEEVDMSEVGPTSLDSRRSEEVKQSKLREEAQYEKDRGNNFVKQEKWDEAVQCYNRAIELINYDAIYYANRALCHLKKDRLRQAESDCTEAIRLDGTYVKAYQRRAAAREKLGSLRSASLDLVTVIQLEPKNLTAQKQLIALKEKMATKGGKFKSSPVTTPTDTSPPELPNQPMIVALPDVEPEILEAVSTKVYAKKEKTTMDKWMDGTLDNVQVVQPVDKPPHLRSKKEMREIKINEIQLGDTNPKKQQIKSSPIITNGGGGDCVQTMETRVLDKNINQHSSPKDVETPSLTNEAEKQSEININENNIDPSKLTPPTTCVQFMAEWRSYKNNAMAKIAYLNVINPEKFQGIFQNSLESEVLSDIIHTLAIDPGRYFAKRISSILRSLTNVKRFGALVMFLSPNDKRVVKDLLLYCKEQESCDEEDVNDLENKFEL